MSPEELLALDDHLTACEACRARLDESVGRRPSVVALWDSLEAGPEIEDEHISYEQLVASTGGQSEQLEPGRVKSHLELCARCRREVQELRAFQKLMARYPAKEHVPAARPSLWDRLRAYPGGLVLWHALPAVGAAAASALAVFWVGLRPLRTEVVAYRTAAAQLGQANDMLRRSQEALQRQAAAVPELQSRAARLEQERSRLQRQREQLRQEAERLRRSAGPSGTRPMSPPTGAAAPGTRIALCDGAGQVMVDRQGSLVRMQPQPLRADVKNAWRSEKVRGPAVIARLIGERGKLLGGAAEGQAFAVLRPAGLVVQTDRPRFEWRPLPGADSYSVTVMDEDYNPVVESERVSATKWELPQPLERGRIYKWDVCAYKGGERLAKTPMPPAPDAMFKVLERDRSQELDGAKQRYAGSHLTLGVLYAEAGLLDEAQREFEALLQANPRSSAARNLLESVRKLREPSPAR